MHHIAYTSCIFCTYPCVLLSFLTLFSKLSHQYNSRANFRRKMDNLEQENRELREEVYALKAGMANLTALMESLVAAYNQPPLSQPQQTTFSSEGLSVLVSIAPVIVAHNRMPQGYPRGMLENFIHSSFSSCSSYRYSHTPSGTYYSCC